MRLPTAALLQYERQGYIADRGLLGASTVKSLARTLDELYTQQQLAALQQKVRVLLGDEALAEAEAKAGSGGGGDERVSRRLEKMLDALPEGALPFLQLFNTWRSAPAVLELLRSAALAETAAQLLGAGPRDRVRLYQDSLFVKRGGDGATHWHADLAMAPLDTNAFVTCWLPLQPVPAETGGGTGLVFAAGSHRDVALPFWQGDPRAAGDLSGRYAEGACGAMRLGDASWHHGWTLHCAPPNALPEARRALAASFFLDGAPRLRASRTPDDEDRESHREWLAAVPPGAPARHELLPVVWPLQRQQQQARPASGRGGSRRGTEAGRGAPRGGRRRRGQPWSRARGGGGI